MFNKKQKCNGCKSKIKEDFSFCPYCGSDMRNPQKEMQDYGLLGKDEMLGAPLTGGGSMGFTDKLVSSIFNNLMKSLESQMKGTQNNAEVRPMPNGIQIKLGVPTQRPRVAKKITISEDQLSRMKGVPRVEAKTEIRRLSDKVIYELKAPGIEKIDDIFVSKVESGYEIKAIGKNKVYVNSLQIDLPLRGYTLHEKGLTVEFVTQ